MDFTTTLAGFAAGAAIVGACLRHRAPDPARGFEQAARDRAAAASPDDLEVCPGCGADAVAFGYEEEVDAACRGIDVVRCPTCGWKEPLPPL